MNQEDTFVLVKTTLVPVMFFFVVNHLIVLVMFYHRNCNVLELTFFFFFINHCTRTSLSCHCINKATTLLL